MNTNSMNNDQPLGIANPEASRHLALATKYMLAQDFTRALHYSRLPMVAGSGNGAVSLFTALSLTRRFEAVAELAATVFANPMHHTSRSAILEVLISALCYLGARDGDCSDAYAVAYELATQGNLNPEQKVWDGQSLQGKALLLSLSGDGLGGNGDYVMWARFVPQLAALGPRITVQCPPLLARLFATLPGVVSTCGLEDRPVCDYAISIMQIPHVMRLRGFPTENPFKVAPVAFPQETHNVGINWGASWVAPYMDRSCALGEYLPLTTVPNTALYAIQKGAHQKHLYPPPVGMQVHDLGQNLRDFLDTAICLSSMDAVVTTDNVVGNLSCMLGTPTFVLVPKCADWRWGDAGRAPWYPSARVYQQRVAGEWAQPIAELTRDLAAFLQEKARPLVARKEAGDASPAACANTSAPTAAS